METLQLSLSKDPLELCVCLSLFVVCVILSASQSYQENKNNFFVNQLVGHYQIYLVTTRAIQRIQQVLFPSIVWGEREREYLSHLSYNIVCTVFTNKYLPSVIKKAWERLVWRANPLFERDRGRERARQRWRAKRGLHVVGEKTI